MHSAVKIMLAILVMSCVPHSLAQAASKPHFLFGYIKSDTPAGSATFRKYMIKVYDAQLWMDGERWSYERPFALSLTYDVSIDTDDFVEQTFEEIEASSHISKEDLSQFESDLQQAFPNVKDGDNITALYVPDKAVTFYFNGKKTHQIADTQFAKYFFDIWLSQNTTEPEFRKKLLANLRG